MINMGSRYSSGLSGEVADIARQIKSLKAVQRIDGRATPTKTSYAEWSGNLPQTTLDNNTNFLTSYSVRFNFYPDKQLSDGIPMVLVAASFLDGATNKPETQMLSAGEISADKLVFYGEFYAGMDMTNNNKFSVEATAYSQTGGRLEAEVYAYQHW